MGQVLSKMNWHSGCSTTQKLSTTLISSHHIMALDPDEQLSRSSSPSSPADSSSQEEEDSMFWPYFNIPTNTSHAYEDDPPLKVRRPTLYQEYWAMKRTG